MFNNLRDDSNDPRAAMSSASPLTPVLTLASIDPVARQAATAGLLLDLPDAVVAGYDLVREDGARAISRTLSDRAGIVDQTVVDLDHDCLSCTIRADIVSTLELITDLARWHAVVLALPLATDPAMIARAIVQSVSSGALIGVRPAPVISVIDSEAVRRDVLGDDLLDERGLAHGDHDRRSVGEATCAMIEYADLTLTVGSGEAQDLALLDRLIAPSAAPRTDVHHGDGRRLLASAHDPVMAHDRTDPLAVRPPAMADGDGVWSLDLRSDRPFHPQRLQDRLEDLGTGAVRGRGHFWLPSRPDVVCAWDGSGGQLSIGLHGFWLDSPRQTRLVIIGTDDRDRQRIRAAFADVLMTERELRRLDQWRLIDDGFDPWLGSKASAA